MKFICAKRDTMSNILVVTKIFFLSAHKIQNFIQQLFFLNTSEIQVVNCQI